VRDETLSAWRRKISKICIALTPRSASSHRQEAKSLSYWIFLDYNVVTNSATGYGNLSAVSCTINRCYMLKGHKQSYDVVPAFAHRPGVFSVQWLSQLGPNCHDQVGVYGVARSSRPHYLKRTPMLLSPPSLTLAAYSMQWRYNSKLGL